MNKKTNLLQKIIHFLPIVGIAFFAILVIYGYYLGIFRSVHSLQDFIKQFNDYAILFFIILQIIQVIIPIIPGGISSVAGMLMFSNVQGLIYSYIGLIIGEILGFLLVRHYGRNFVKIVLSPSRYNKFERLLEQQGRNIKRLLIVTMLIPFAPDDLVCLIAGLTNISLKEYTKIILLLKIWSVTTYSYIIFYFLTAL
ncbi:TVP38/TMEM64 family protein [Melissococcus plutonius]|uniref:TVP38/TMEM64 family protein n=1 Tax=Melissococcus plutonius TaxID=33970 RepID=UPI003C307EE2